MSDQTIEHTHEADAPDKAPLKIYTPRAPERRMATTDVIAISLSVVWLAFTVLFFFVTPIDAEGVDSLRFFVTIMAIFMPIALIWVAVTVVRMGHMMRDESARLKTSLDAMRSAYLQSQTIGQAVRPSVERKLDEIVAAQRKTESAIATFASIRSAVEEHAVAAPAIPGPPDEEGQATLALGTPSDALEQPVGVSDFIKALNFPENAEDRDGFRALRLALADRQMSELVRSSQDILTMLSQDGIYMDDLRPDRTRPELWRKFAQGERGRAISGLGGVRDRTCLALTAARMREDAIFRDAAHHFLRRFDKVVSVFQETATDQDIVALSDTRTARAFMLLGRVTGTFT